jgi:hypothetical protein
MRERHLAVLVAPLSPGAQSDAALDNSAMRPGTCPITSRSSPAVS